MDDISEFLALKNPSQHPDYLEDPGDRITRNAIGSIFFAEPGDLQSVLLKRGPVLLGGETRELLVFTGGFLFSRVELDTLVNLVLDVHPEGEEDLDLEALSKRFRDIDVHPDGFLVRGD